MFTPSPSRLLSSVMGISISFVSHDIERISMKFHQHVKNVKCVKT